MAKAVVKHKTSGELFQILGHHGDFLWLQPKGAEATERPFTGDTADYARHVNTEPKAGEVWERQRGTEIVARTVQGLVEHNGLTLVVWKDERRDQVAATAIADFVRTHHFNGKAAVRDQEMVEEA